jgi:hypothetical protein
MILRVPNKLLKELRTEISMLDLVSITGRMVGEMRNPASILVNTEFAFGNGAKMDSRIVNLLQERGCKEVKA